MTAEAYPLQWPPHVPRTPAHKQKWGSFQVTPGEAQNQLVDEVARSGGSHLVLSTNIPLRRDGLPYANHRQPEDPCVAVYYMRKGKQVCIPCDAYDKVWKNMRAIGLSIRDMRGPEKRGCAAITDQAFSGFTALPPPDAEPTERSWHEVLKVDRDADTDAVEIAWRVLRRKLHPDAPGGSTEAFQQLQRAYEQAKAVAG